MTDAISILAVDDELDFVQTLRDVLQRQGYHVEISTSGYEALQVLNVRHFDLIILDLNMPLINGIETLKRVQQMDPSMPVIILTADSRIQTVVDAMKLGAYDYFQKPLHWDKFEISIRNALMTRELRGEVSRLRGQLQTKYRFDNVIGESKSMQAVFRSIERVLDTNVTVSLRGESGTGKELLARALHFNSVRKSKPFIAVNCSAIPETLLESELFGHEKGAFTGAVAQRIGKFEQSQGGTILLDEIGEMSATTQVKILRVLQEKRFQRVGGSTLVEVDVRIISATNKDLESAMRDGSFREDLYYRINVYPIIIPPLRQRKEDIPALSGFFLEKYNRNYGHRVDAIQPRAMDYLVRYDWPGNVRELENILERSFLNATDETLKPEHLPITITSGEDGLNHSDTYIDLKKIVPLTKKIIPLKELEKEVLMQALRLTNYNMSSAASELGIGRTTLYRKLKNYRIDLKR